MNSSPAPANSYPVELLPVARLRRDRTLQMRSGINDQTRLNYRQNYVAGVKMPPVRAVFDGTDYLVWDGNHRLLAQLDNDAEQVEVEVRPGTFRDAVYLAIGANKENGLQRGEGDLKRALRTLLTDAEWSTKSDGEISRHVGCSRAYVTTQRNKLAAEQAGTGNCDQSMAPAERTFTNAKGETVTKKTGGVTKSNKARAAAKAAHPKHVEKQAESIDSAPATASERAPSNPLPAAPPASSPEAPGSSEVPVVLGESTPVNGDVGGAVGISLDALVFDHLSLVAQSGCTEATAVIFARGFARVMVKMGLSQVARHNVATAIFELDEITTHGTAWAAGGASTAPAKVVTDKPAEEGIDESQPAFKVDDLIKAAKATPGVVRILLGRTPVLRLAKLHRDLCNTSNSSAYTFVDQELSVRWSRAIETNDPAIKGFLTRDVWITRMADAEEQGRPVDHPRRNGKVPA